MKSYKEFINKYEGETAFICGAGPSFYDIILSYKFYQIFKHVVISVNSTIISMPWKNEKIYGFDVDPNKCFWISNDAMCRRWSWWEDVKKAKCNKIVRDSWLKYEDELDGFYLFSPRPTSEDIINESDEGLAYCSSVPSGIDLALQMGCKTIYLLGVDHKESLGYRHFWELLDKNRRPIANPPAQGSWENQKEVFEINKKAFKALNGLAQKKKAKIVNCQSWIVSAIDEFEKEYWENIF